MQNLQWNLFDKSYYPEGEWKNEPDKIQWLDDETKYPCLIRRVERTGALCGYVGVSRTHPLYGYYDAWQSGLEVHGGINYAGKCNKHICHVVEDGEDDDIWWLGFDCAHPSDARPIDLAATSGWVCPPELKEVEDSINSALEIKYRNIDYVKQQCAKLALQLRQIELENK